MVPLMTKFKCFINKSKLTIAHWCKIQRIILITFKTSNIQKYSWHFQGLQAKVVSYIQFEEGKDCTQFNSIISPSLHHTVLASPMRVEKTTQVPVPPREAGNSLVGSSWGCFSVCCRGWGYLAAGCSPVCCLLANGDYCPSL